MSFVSFIARRSFHSIFVLLGLSIMIFIIARILPGDPALVAVGARAPQWVVDNLREHMHLNDPIHIQYGFWLRDALRGDFGTSLYTRRAVVDDIKEFFPATIELVLFAAIVTAVFGIGLGMLSARHKDKWIDNFVRVLAYMGVVIPSFLFAILFILIFSYKLGWLPTVGRLSEDVAMPPRVTGLTTVDALLAGQPETFLDASRHIILPGLALAVASVSQGARITRSSMADNMTKDYVVFARSLGVSEDTILRRVLLKPSLIPTVSIMGLDIAALFSIAFIVESIFIWPGLSRYAMNTILTKDLNGISAVVLVFGVIFVSVNLIVDIIVTQLDPRIGLRAVGAV